MNMGLFECLLTAFVCLLVFGPKRLVQFSQDFGQIWQHIQLAYNKMRAEWHSESSIDKNHDN